MIKKVKYTTLALLIAASAWAGNKDRTGQAGAGELLLNPWARTTGVFGLNGATVTGAEAMKCNIAGLAKVSKLDVGLSHTRYLSGSGMSISNAAVGYKTSDAMVIGVNVMSFGFGDIPITTETSPEGGNGNFRPSFINMSLGLGYNFSDKMCAGISATYINEAISNIKASAVGFDAGVQYVNGRRDNLHIGVTLRNVGTNLRFSGDGFSFNGQSPDFAREITTQSRSEKFSLPSQLNIAIAYDFYLDESTKSDDNDTKPQHRLTTMGSFISNAYNSDWLGLGIEYSYKDVFMARFGYRHESQIGDKKNTTTFFTGFSAGATLQPKITKESDSKSANLLAIDYSFRPTRISSGVHAVGVRLTIPSSK